MIVKEDVKTLVSLRLSPNQAKVYLAVIEIGVAEISEISKVSGVARQAIYPKVSELQKIGLIEKILAKPVKFKAIPLSEGVQILLEQIEDESKKIHKKANQLIRRFKTKKVNKKVDGEKSQFILISNIDVKLRTIKAINNTKKTMEGITSKEKLFTWAAEQKQLFNKVLENGVRIRYIIDKLDYDEFLPDGIKVHLKNNAVIIKFLPTIPPVHFVIFDGKEMILNITPTVKENESDALWTTDTNILKLAKDYYEILWVTAIEDQNMKSLEN